MSSGRRSRTLEGVELRGAKEGQSPIVDAVSAFTTRPAATAIADQRTQRMMKIISSFKFETTLPWNYPAVFIHPTSLKSWGRSRTQQPMYFLRTQGSSVAHCFEAFGTMEK